MIMPARGTLLVDVERDALLTADEKFSKNASVWEKLTPPLFRMFTIDVVPVGIPKALPSLAPRNPISIGTVLFVEIPLTVRGVVESVTVVVKAIAGTAPLASHGDDGVGHPLTPNAAIDASSVAALSEQVPAV